MAEQLRQSITETAQQFLERDVPGRAAPITVLSSTSSVLENALAKGITLREYVTRNPEQAMMEAEASLAEWLKIQSNAAIQGTILTDQGTFQVTKNMTAILKERVDAAFKQRDLVSELYYTSTEDGEKRRDHLTRVLYNRAVHGGDTRALIYMIDRVDGRPAESRAVDVDYDNSYNVYQIISCLFDKQLEVLNSGKGTRLVCCSRQSGKSMMFAAVALINALQTSNNTVVLLGETMELTEGIFDQSVNFIVDRCKLRDKTGRRLNWRHLDNGSHILVRGLSNTKDPDQIRGIRSNCIIIDEFFHLKDNLLKYMVEEVLEPMQMSFGHDYLFLAGGTPPPIKGTYGEHAWKNWDVPHFFWTYEQNPHPTDPAEKKAAIENKLREKGLTFDSIYARREYGGEWIYDEDLLLYPEYHCYNADEGIPQINVDMVLFGIDYGVSDSDTLVGIAWDTAARKGYTFCEEKFSRLDMQDRTVSQLQYLRGRVLKAWARALEFFPTYGDKEANKRIIWVADDSDQHLTEDFNLNCRLDGKDIRLNIMNAHKTDKVYMFDKIRDLLRTANLLIMEEGKVAKECDQTIMKRGANGQVYPEVDDKAYHPDLLPAMRYALWTVIGNEREGA